MSVIISEALIELSMNVSSKEEALKILADKLFAEGYVKDVYYENVIRREKEFPTGLPTIVPVALCHTEAEYVLESALAVATLAKSVTFQEMGSPERTVQAEIIFLLALKNPKDQVSWLKKMVTVFKSKELLEKIKSTADKQELAAFMKELFLD